MIENSWSRREFLEFMGRTTLAASILPYIGGCASQALQGPDKLPFRPLQATLKDDLVLAEGFKSDVLISWGDALTDKLRFGFNNDYTAFFPISSDSAILWVNHESVNPLFVTGWSEGKTRSREDIAQEMKEVGGSLVHIENKSGKWSVVKNSPYNRRLDAQTKIPIIAPRAIAESKTAIGTLANCAGGVTPWGTLLTCEENYDKFYGDNVHRGGEVTWKSGKDYIEWHDFFPYAPEHYGWVVEVDPKTGSAKKLTALGRFAHESATTVLSKDGRCVVYSGDDHNDECLYKFISKKPGSLEEGELFVANLKTGKWMSLDLEKSPVLKKTFADQTAVLIRCRDAALILGATRLDRPEDVEIDPATGAVLVALTNNKKAGNYHGSILRIIEDGGDHASLTFKSSTFLTGGKGAGFTCPDNMAFDKRGNLWLTNDVSDSELNRGRYLGFGNNSLFYIPMSGPLAGTVHRVASSPVTAEFTGPTFSPDGRTLFLSVQHPGEGTTDLKKPLSHWPEGGTTTPKPSVVTITGPALTHLVG